MKTIRILSSDFTLIENLKAEIEKYIDLKRLPTISDGQTMLELLLNEPPDIILIDLALPLIDGIDVIEMQARIPMRDRPMIFAMADVCTPRMFQLIKEHIVHLFIKPFDVVPMIHLVAEFARMHEPSDTHMALTHAAVDKLVTDCLIELGIPAHLLGYHTLREGIKIIVCAKSRVKLSIVKHIYQSIAEQFNSNVSAVEHSMRHAIDSAWTRADINVLQDYFGYTFNEMHATPSNSQFMFMVAERVRMQFDTEFQYR
ncbi:MAG: sporulation initiation factor Spo0A C-terminal domain-containing protein [Eubacteriales bacterium]|nr:sporulation initiation factor Spo0A C-terminal domain-containing protein [Eubacteriales bacterium]